MKKDKKIWGKAKDLNYSEGRWKVKMLATKIIKCDER